jgi:hypothetical protein
MRESTTQQAETFHPRQLYCALDPKQNHSMTASPGDDMDIKLTHFSKTMCKE